MKDSFQTVSQVQKKFQFEQQNLKNRIEDLLKFESLFALLQIVRKLDHNLYFPNQQLYNTSVPPNSLGLDEIPNPNEKNLKVCKNRPSNSQIGF